MTLRAQFLFFILPRVLEAYLWSLVTPTNSIDGRTAAALCWSQSQGRLYSFNGYIHGGSGVELVYFDLETSTWTTVTGSSGTVPSDRIFHSAVFDDTHENMYIYGGCTSSCSTKFDTFASYDTNANSWTDLSGLANSPGDRYGHAATFDPDSTIMYLYGGGNSIVTYVNTVHKYDVVANSWTEMTTSGTAPTGSHFATAVLSRTDQRLWIFGGSVGGYHDLEAHLNDLHYLDLATATWTGPISTSGEVPSARMQHAAAWSVSKNEMYIFGGREKSTNLALNDLRSYSPATNEWTLWPSLGDVPTELVETSFAFSETMDALFIFGGQSDNLNGTYFADLYVNYLSFSFSTTTTVSSTSSTTRTSTSTSTSTSTRSTSSISSTSTGTSTASSSTTSTSTSSASRTGSSTTLTSSSTSGTSSTRSTTMTGSSTTSRSISRSTTSSTSSRTTTVTTRTTRTTSTTSTIGTTKTTSSSLSQTTTSSTRTEAAVLSPAEMRQLERQRKEEAAKAVAAVESAENDAVLQALSMLSSSNSTGPGVLGEVVMELEVGVVYVTLLSLDSLVASGAEVVELRSQDDAGVDVEISVKLLEEVAAIAGSSNLLMSRLSLTSDASWALRKDHILATDEAAPPAPRRRLASVVRSGASSLNFRNAAGAKLTVENLAEPMVLVMPVDDSNATCAFWDEENAVWSTEGVETLRSEAASSSLLSCSTRHLSVFAAVMSAILRNVALALKCSTFSSLMTPEAFEKLTQLPQWFLRPASLVSWLILLVLWLSLFLTIRADRRSFQLIPWIEREVMLLREKPKDQEAEAEAEEKEQQRQQEPGSAGEAKPSDSEAKRKSESFGEQPQESMVPTVPTVPAAEGRGDALPVAPRARGQTDHAIGGDWELPTVFRMFRGIAEGLLDILSQATGGDNFVDGVKEFVANAETGTVNSSIEMLHAQRTGADPGTLSVIQESRELHHAGSTSGALQYSRRKSGQSVGGLPEISRQALVSEARTAEASSDAQVLEVHEPPERTERTASSHVSSEMSVEWAQTKVQNWYGSVAQEGETAAVRFLNSGPLCRMLMLFPAAHTWAKVFQLSIMVSYSVRVALIGMKVISSGWLNAVFFASDAPTPDSDPECNPPEDPFEKLVQSVTVGFVTAFLSDGIIFLVYMIQRKRVIEKEEWTEEMVWRQRLWWRRRDLAFWVITFIYLFFITLYTFLFIANVREVDATQWLEATLTSLFQDFIFKPFVVCIILTCLSTFMLCWKPNLRREIEEEWGGAACSTVEEIAPKAQSTNDDETSKEQHVAASETAPLPALPGAVE